MSLEYSTPPPTVSPQKQAIPHPLAPLTREEIQQAAYLIRSIWPGKTELRFKVITLEEPLKAEALSFLEAEHASGQLPYIARKVFVNYYLKNTVCTCGQQLEILQTNVSLRTNSTKQLSIYQRAKSRKTSY
jgi:primary-amine oxidase